MNIIKTIATGSVALMLMFGGVSVANAEGGGGDYQFSSGSPDFVHGVPTNPEEAWILATGARIYDNWWEALDVAEPKGTHPSYPATSEKEGEGTWRCKTCHGWDYKGKDGIYATGSNFTGIMGIDGAAGRSEEQIAAIIRDDTHRYSSDMIDDASLGRIAAFVNRGQVDTLKYVDVETRLVKEGAGDINVGRGIFQTVCAACHGFDGRLLDWGDETSSNFIGTEASELADEVLHKILSSHPGAAMINLRAFPLKYSVDVLAYAATLPTD